MQAFSHMQRSRGNLYIVANFAFAIFLLIYETTSALYQLFPPLIGLFFALVLTMFFRKDKKFQKLDSSYYFVIFFLFFAEQIHGFALFSIFISFMIFYFLIFKILLKIIKIRNFILILAVIFGYVSPFLITNALNFLLEEETLKFGYEYAIYIVIESSLAVFLFRGKLV